VDRIEIIKNWLKSQLNQGFEVVPASSDASFRRYFRIISNNKTYILMDAPPALERISLLPQRLIHLKLFLSIKN
jgi:aminoglycoside/choline kinase family phosphotransferase